MKKLVINTRFYILAAAFLASIFVVAFFRTKFPSDQLYYIRTEQLFGLLAIALVYVAILITPLSKLWPKARLTKQVLFARRGIGVAAAYFAALHAFITIQQQLGGISGALLLPLRYKISFGFATVAFVILVLMAATSFDKAMKLMTFRRWKLLHRFVYLAIVLIMLHIWLIGTHVEYAPIRYATYSLLGILILLESFRVAAGLKLKWRLEQSVYFGTAIGFCTVGIFSLVLLSSLAQNYHSEHSATPDAQFHSHKESGR